MAGLEQIKKTMIQICTQKRDADYAFKMGYDCAINGANQTNCHFSLFGTKKMTTAWENGNKAGKEKN